MAATASSRAHLIHKLNSRRTSNTNPSSPGDEEYATATSASSFDAGRDAIHSTAQMQEITTQQPLPGQQFAAQYDQFPDNASEGSAEMSIELGRGVKRGARDREADLSEQNIVFNMGGDSFYELTATPPLASQKVRGGQQKKMEDGILRRQASIQAAKRTTSTKHPRSLSEALHKARVEDVDDSFPAEEVSNTATFNARNTRFARLRQTSAAQPQQQTPRRGAVNNPTAQSNSFMLPDLPNITELVSGTRKDGTPLFARTTKPSQSRSRFTSGAFNNKPLRPEHVPVESVPIPEDEKAIYASLQLLRDRVAQLESEKSEAAKRVEEYEIDIIELRAQLAIAQKRPDSGLGSSAGSDDEVAGVIQGKAKLQANVKSLQGQLGRSERKTSVAEISLQRVTRERDELITQIGVAYYNNEELKVENDAVKAQINGLGAENDELKAEVDALRQENQDLRVLVAQTRASYEDDATRRSAHQTGQTQKRTAATGLDEREIREAARLVLEQTPRRIPQTHEKGRSKRNAVSDQTGQATHGSRAHGEATSDDLAIRIAQEVRKNREAANGAARSSSERQTRAISQSTAGAAATSTRQRSRSKSQTRTAIASKYATLAERDQDLSDAESTTQLDFTSLRNRKRASMPTSAVAAQSVPAQRDEDSRDLTLLSWMDPNKLSDLRKRIEEEHRAKRLVGARAASAPSGGLTENAAPMMSGGLGRKSSMKDVTVGSGKRDVSFGPDDFARIAKSVRVQSPHSSFDAMPNQQQTGNLDQYTGDVSISSNTSRRRRRAASAEGMTSAFILPDITLSGREGQTKPAHDAGNCTACPPGPKDVTIPTPVPVTDRPQDIPADVTSATIRPSQPPPLALATVIKQLQDEINHLKLQLGAQQQLYSKHDPALSKRRRMEVKARMDKLTSDIEKRSDQVYSLYDVLEGQKAAEAAGAEIDDAGIEETLQSLGIDPAELSGRIGRNVYGNDAREAFGLDGASDSGADLPFEGFSDMGEAEE
jgi:cell division protein FtsB